MTACGHAVFPDHLVHVMDFRNSKESYSMLKGHKKTVSYLEFISNEELVSALVVTSSSLALVNFLFMRIVR